MKVTPLHLPAPVLIALAENNQPIWKVRSDTQNRPLRVKLAMNAHTAEILSRQDFSQRPLLDRIIGTDVAAHEGQLFGWANQLLGLLTAVGLVLVVTSAIILWWQRRPALLLGAPVYESRHALASGLQWLMILLGLLLPLLGFSLVLVMLLERWLLPHFPRAQIFLGLPQTRYSARLPIKP